jgi:hypothetical protein
VSLSNVRDILAVHSVSEALRSFLSLFRRHADVLQDVPFSCLLEIPGFLKISFHYPPKILDTIAPSIMALK